MQRKTDGLVIRESSVGESDRLVTVLTRDDGLLRAFAQRAKQTKSAKLSGTQLLSYSRFAIYRGRDAYIIDEARPIQIFFDLRRDIGRLSLAQYFCELALALAPEQAEAGDFLRLMLNALHFLSKGQRPNEQLKAIVELRALSLAGYMPDLIGCAQCRVYEAPEMFFLPRVGQILCGECFHKGCGKPAIPLAPGPLTGMRHCIYAQFEKLFSFSLPGGALKELSKASEQYMLHTIGRSFPTLEFYHQMEG